MNIVSRHVFATLLSCAALGAVSSVGLAADAPATAAAPAATYEIPKSAPKYIRDAVENPARPAEQKARDAVRKPAEVLVLSGVKPGDTVVEFASFGQYFTSMLSDIVGSKGNVYMYDLLIFDERAGAASRAFVAAHPNSKYELVDYNTLKLPENVYIVFNVLYYHDLPLNNIDTASLNKRIFDALKPGGVYIVIDHAAAPGAGATVTSTLHRIDPETVKSEVTAAGFKLEDESTVLKNPDDPHTAGVRDPSIRGKTDQFVLKFRKPKK